MREFDFRTNNFDLIRLLAAFQVAFIHGYHHFGIQSGSAIVSLLELFPGVPIFFAISGFLISASVERSQSLRSYARNRLLRIYPGLWVCFIISATSAVAIFNPSYSWTDMAKWAVAQMTLGQFYNPEFLRGYGVGVLNGSLWTIPVELQFYAALPLIYAILGKTRWSPTVCCAGMLALVAANQLYIHYGLAQESLLIKLLGVTIVPYLYIFFIGVFLQRNLRLVSTYLQGRAATTLLAYLALSFAASQLGLSCTGNYLNPLSATALSLLTISLGYTCTDRLRNILHGHDISYGVYIYHMVFVNLLLHLSALPPAANLVAMLAATVGAAGLSWRLIERPALSLKSQTIRDASRRIQCPEIAPRFEAAAESCQLPAGKAA